MTERKPFLLRIDRSVLDALQRWANDDLRSLNGQIEFLLRRALAQADRPVATTPPGGAQTTPEDQHPSSHGDDQD